MYNHMSVVTAQRSDVIQLLDVPALYKAHHNQWRNYNSAHDEKSILHMTGFDTTTSRSTLYNY